MTEKRFTIDFDNRRIIDNKKNEYLVFLAQFKEVLNQLNDENEQLKSELGESKKAHSRCDKLWWKLHDEKEQLEKENEQLKSELKTLQLQDDDRKQYQRELEKENE